MLSQNSRNYGFDYAVLPGVGGGGGMAKEEEEDGGGEEEELTHSCVFCFGEVIASPVAKEASFYARMTSSMCGRPISIWSGFLFRGRYGGMWRRNKQQTLLRYLRRGMAKIWGTFEGTLGNSNSCSSIVCALIRKQ